MRLPRHLRDLIAALNIGQRQVQQYARSKSAESWLGGIWDFLSGKTRRPPPDVPKEFWERLKNLGTSAHHPLPAKPIGRPGVQPSQPTTRPSEPPPPFSSRGNRAMREPPRPGEQTDLSEFIDCSRQSSNVYGFQYDYKKKLLYVAYQGHQLNKSALSRGTVKRGGRSSREQNIGTLGQTVTGARGGRGATYAYHAVPKALFERMLKASSKGKFVWDELRVRGTIYGHKFRYTLVQGQVQPKNGGVYIPRKATKAGFRSRSLVDMGSGTKASGKLSFQTSTLPTRSFGNRASSRRRGR